MAMVEDILTECISATIGDWCEPKFTHPFLNINILSVPDSKKRIPHRWVDDVQIDDIFDGGDLPLGGTTSALLEEGRQRLLRALRRLDLPEDHVTHASLDRMGRHELAAEKRRVKQELKRYDAEFRKQFSRLPTHTEKEPMRPLYVYYRRLKTMIAQLERHRESLTTIPDMEEPPAVEDQISALEARIETLQGERATVRAKLQAFQEQFVSDHNRKIRFHKDILPIEREYRMYKTLKEDITKAEQQLKDFRSES